jgi:hypothetical protein
MQQTFFGRTKSLAGAALVGLGIFIFHGNLDRAATLWSHLLSTIPGEAPGVLSTVILAAPRVLQAYAADHQRFLQDFLRHIFVSCWPLLLVLVGTVLLRDTFTDDVNALPRKDCRLVDLTAAPRERVLQRGRPGRARPSLHCAWFPREDKTILSS